VHHRPDGARRGRGRVREPPEPVGLCRVPDRGRHARSAAGASHRPALGGVSRAEGASGGSRHLDHHALDPSGESGGRRSSGPRVRLLRSRRAGGGGGEGPSPQGAGRDRAGPARGEDDRGGGRRGLGRGAGRPQAHPRVRHGPGPGGVRLPASIHRPAERHRPRRARDAGTGHRARPHRPGARPGGLRGRPQVRARHLQPGPARRPLRRHGPAALAAGSEGLRRQSEGRGAARGARCATQPLRRDGRAQLSALLALPQPDHLPGDTPVVHRDGPSARRDGGPRCDAARAGADRDRPAGALDSGMGPLAHPRDGGEPPRLDPQPPADLGRAHPGAPLRCLRRVGGEPRAHRAGRGCG